MATLVLAIEKPFWQDVLLQMQTHGVEISAAVVHYRDVGAPNHFFEQFKGKQVNGKKFYRIEDLNKLIQQDFGTDYPALDQKTINDFRDIERDFYLLTDRFNYFPKSFRYKKRLFRENLRYWLAFFQHNKIDSVFIGCTPHNIADYTAYHTARKLGIKTVLIAHTMINDHVLLRNDYRERETIPSGFMPGASEEEVKAAIRPELYDCATETSAVLQYVISKNDASVKAKNLNVKKERKKKAFKFNLKNIRKIARRIHRIMVKAPKFKGALAIDGIYSPLARRLIKLREVAYQKKMRKVRDGLAITPNLNENFIYFAMHMQPERTSTPEAEVFEDHLLAVDILSKAVPEGWKIYVKENPRQYDKINLIKGRHQRDKSDYSDLLKLPNVRLISQHIPSKDLLDKAQAVSTLSGSVGWEAITKGKPCIIFANAWYAACESTYRVESVEEARTAIEACKYSTAEKVRLNMLRYLAALQDRLIIGNMGTSTYLKTAKVPYEEHVKSVAEHSSRNILNQPIT